MSMPAEGAPQFPAPAKSKKRTRSGRPMGLILAVLLLAGAAAAVWYFPIPGLTAPDSSTVANPTAGDAATGSAASASPDQVSREAALVAREKELADLAASLKERETKVNQLLKELTTQQTSVEMTRRLSVIYGNMAPAKAAQLLAGMDRPTAVEILRLLEERQTADILAAMDPTVALQLIGEMTKPLPAAGTAPGNG